MIYIVFVSSHPCPYEIRLCQYSSKAPDLILKCLAFPRRVFENLFQKVINLQASRGRGIPLRCLYPGDLELEKELDRLEAQSAGNRADTSFGCKIDIQLTLKSGQIVACEGCSGGELVDSKLKRRLGR